MNISVLLDALIAVVLISGETPQWISASDLEHQALISTIFVEHPAEEPFALAVSSNHVIGVVVSPNT